MFSQRMSTARVICKLIRVVFPSSKRMHKENNYCALEVAQPSDYEVELDREERPWESCLPQILGVKSYNDKDKLHSRQK